MSNDNPRLALVSDPGDLQQVVALFKRLTGREPTQDELDEVKAELDAPDNEEGD